MQRDAAELQDALPWMVIMSKTEKQELKMCEVEREKNSWGTETVFPSVYNFNPKANDS